PHRSARALRTRAARYHPRLAARALRDIAGKYPRWRHAAWACQIDQQTATVLLRLRRALGHGGTGGAGRRSYHGMPHWGRTRRLEESQRAAGALTETRGPRRGSCLHCTWRECTPRDRGVRRESRYEHCTTTIYAARRRR